MKKVLKKVWKELANHNRYKSISFVVCIVMLIYSYGCPVRCNSVIDKNKKVTAEELQLEIETVLAKAAIEANSLERQEKLRKYIFDSALNICSGGSVNWYGILTGCGSILTVGAVTDNIRQRIKKPKA